MEEMPNERMQRVVQYLEGELDATERAAFEREVEGDPALRADLDAARKTLSGLQALGEERLRRALIVADTTLDGGTRTGSMRWWWAAASVLVIGVTAWWLIPRDTPQELAIEFAYTEPGLPVLMGSSGSMDAIMNAYKQGDLAAAGGLLNASLAREPMNDTLNYFAGVVAARSENCAGARVRFDLVLDGSRFHPQARYHAALCALHAGDVALAREQLEQVTNAPDAQLAGKARGLLERLNDL